MKCEYAAGKLDEHVVCHVLAFCTVVLTAVQHDLRVAHSWDLPVRFGKALGPGSRQAFVRHMIHVRKARFAADQGRKDGSSLRRTKKAQSAM